VAETLDKEPQTMAPTETQLEQQPVALSMPSNRRPAIVGASFALVVIGAAAYDLPKFDVVLPNFPSFAELSPSKTAAPIPDPAVGATLKEIQSAQQQDVAAVQESGALLKQNTALLQQGAATLEPSSKDLQSNRRR
jgi:hypothetical protein